MNTLDRQKPPTVTDAPKNQFFDCLIDEATVWYRPHHVYRRRAWQNKGTVSAIFSHTPVRPDILQTQPWGLLARGLLDMSHCHAIDGREAVARKPAIRDERLLMIGKLIIFAILGVLAYAVYLRVKARVTGTALPEKPQKAVKERRPFGGAVQISKIHLIITGLAILYLVWALASLYR